MYTMFKDLNLKSLELSLRKQIADKEEEEARQKIVKLQAAVSEHRRNWGEEVEGKISQLVMSMLTQGIRQGSISVMLVGTTAIFQEHLMPVVKEIVNTLNAKEGVSCSELEVGEGRMASLNICVFLPD
jgi:hypothetical protein